MSNDTSIKCPECDAEINVNEVLYAQFKSKVDQEHILQKKKLNEQERENSKKIKSALDGIEKREELFSEKLEKATNKKLKKKKKQYMKSLKVR